MYFALTKYYTHMYIFLVLHCIFVFLCSHKPDNIIDIGHTFSKGLLERIERNFSVSHILRNTNYAITSKLYANLFYNVQATLEIIFIKNLEDIIDC